MNDPLGLFEDDKDPLGLFTEAPKKKADWKTALNVMNEQAANTLDTGLSVLGGGLVSQFDTDLADKIYEGSKRRNAERLKAANPDDAELGFGQKAVGMGLTLPVQMLAMPFSPADTGKTMLDAGEKLPTAITGSLIDTAGNVVGAALPGAVGSKLLTKVATGAASNAAQDYAVRKALEQISDTEEAKKQLGPDAEATALAAILGGGMGSLHTKAAPVVEPTLRDMPVREEAPVKPMGEQLELPLSNSVEDIANRRAEQHPQLDMFAELEKNDPLQLRSDLEAIQAQEAQQKLAMEQAPEERPDYSADIERAYAEREAQQVTQRTEEAQQAREAVYQQLEEELRANAYKGPDLADVRQRRGRQSRKQGGYIDLGDDLQTIKKRFEKFSVEVEPVKFGDSNSVMLRLKTPDGKLSGFVDFAVREDGTLVAENAQVADGLRGKGAAARMYLAAREAGYDIAPGRVQTDLGKRMVESLQRKGIINKEAAGPRFDAGDLNLVPLAGERLPGERYVPRSQRGGIDFQGVSEALSKVFQGKVQTATRGPVREIVGKSAIPVDPDIGKAIAVAKAEGRDGKGINNLASGGTLESLTRRSGLIDTTQKIVQNAMKRAELMDRMIVHPVEKAFRKLNPVELANLDKVFKEEMFGRKSYTVEQLQARGMTEKELTAYAGMRQMFHDTLDIQNQAREKLGLEPVSEKEHYFSSRWQGDFRQPVYDAQGRLVWYLAANSRMGLQAQAKALKAANPTFVIDPQKSHVVRSGVGKHDLQTMYRTMLDVLGADNPAVKDLKQAFEDAVATETSNFAGQQKHFESKGNIRGFIGDRPGKEGTTAERRAMFQEQLQYAKNAFKWAAMQEAGTKLKTLFSDEELNAQQPKNMEYAKQYFQNNAGSGTAQWVSAAENAFRSLGVSPSVIGKAVGSTKSFFITQKLAGSIGYTAANLMQITSTIPHMVDAMVKLGANPLRGIAMGLTAGPLMAASHYLQKGRFNDLGKDAGFYEQAAKYAEDNGVTARSIYDEAPITKSGPLHTALDVAGKTMSIPETLVRSSAYMTFVGMLKDTKKFEGNNQALFQKAEELTNASMVDYRAGERPMLFSKLGTVGDALNTLQTFPVNLMNQYRYFGKEALRGNPAPLIAMLVVQGAMAGASGIPFFNDMDKLWGWVKEQLPDAQWEKVKDFDPKLWMIDNLGEASVYGAVSTLSGVNMTNRLSAPGLSDMAVSPAAPITDIAKQVGSVGSVIADPSATNVAQAVRNVAPTGMQGFLETNTFKDENSVPRQDGTTLYKKATNLADMQGQYARTPQEEKLRALGLRSQREAMSNEVAYKIGQVGKQADERSKNIVEKFYTAVRNGNTKRAQELDALYTRINGTAISNEQLNTQIMEEHTTTIERASTAAKKLEALKGIARIRQMMEDRDAIYGR